MIFAKKAFFSVFLSVGLDQTRCAACSLESLNAYLMGLANEQRPKNSAPSQAVEKKS